MELLPAGFLSALLAIIIIDLVLAGDNAIVIALAARNLQPHLRTRAVVWGCFGAIAVRTAMTLVVVWLLKIPGLLLLGGALLVWIAYKLLAQGDGANGHEVRSETTFWGAMKTIVVADAVMGLDNVLAVAGAAHGSFLLVVFGLLISIPIVIWGSQIILRFVERYPVIIYVGGAVLAWTAAKMMVSEPLLRAAFAAVPAAQWAVYVAVLGGVLSAGFVANQAGVRARVARHLADFGTMPAVSGAAATRLLVPVDGSRQGLEGVRRVIDHYRNGLAPEVHLVHVRTPFKQHVARFLARSDLDAYHRDRAERALKSARGLLERHGIPYAAHVELGDRADMIDRVARRVGAERIVMGTARKNSLTRLLEDSVTSRVLELAQVPVEVVPADAVPPVERVAVHLAIAVVLLLILASL